MRNHLIQLHYHRNRPCTPIAASHQEATIQYLLRGLPSEQSADCRLPATASSHGGIFKVEQIVSRIVSGP
jgi:hypothetical protein